jgi:hypothetical protein
LDELSRSHGAERDRNPPEERVVAVSLVPVPSEEEHATCPNCSAALAPDQRYCLACGKPVSPVRLAFLDVLQSENQPYPGGATPVGAYAPVYAPIAEPSTGASSWLRRYSGLFGLLGVLLLAIIIGLLVGHWITQNKAPGTSTVKIEGLAGLAPTAANAPAAPTTTAPRTTTPSSTPPAATITTTPKAEAKEAKEAKAIEKAPPPKPVKVTPAKLQKLGSSTGKKHEEEVAKLGAEPIETG